MTTNILIAGNVLFFVLAIYLLGSRQEIQKRAVQWKLKWHESQEALNSTQLALNSMSRIHKLTLKQHEEAITRMYETGDHEAASDRAEHVPQPNNSVESMAYDHALSYDPLDDTLSINKTAERSFITGYNRALEDMKCQ